MKNIVLICIWIYAACAVGALDAVKVQRYGVLTDSRDRSFFSDHLPVLVTLDL